MLWKVTGGSTKSGEVVKENEAVEKDKEEIGVSNEEVYVPDQKQPG